MHKENLSPVNLESHPTALLDWQGLGVNIALENAVFFIN